MMGTEALKQMHTNSEGTVPTSTDPDADDIRSTPADIEHHERTYWRGCTAEGEAEPLAMAILQRLQLCEDRCFLAIDPDQRATLDRFLRDVARRRLDRLPLRQKTVDRALGHPTRLAWLAFEQQGEHTPAAALYALTHDELEPLREPDSDAACLSLRFALARNLATRPAEPDVARNCVSLAKKTLDALDQTEYHPDPELREDILAWLAQQEKG